MRLSVIVSTRNRPEKIGNCLKSILANLFSDFEIIVIDQSDSNQTKRIVGKISSPQVRYFRVKTRGLSRARNLGIKKTKGGIIAFTDDDCLVDKNWVKNINKFFIKNINFIGVFGAVLPFRPEEHKNQICPATFEGNRKKVIDHPHIVHYRDLGVGNNMSFRKSIFSKVGYFKEWLGVGAVCMAGGIESELIYRILRKNYKLAFIPNIIVHHDRWLSYHQERILQGKYTCGLMAFYFYYFLKKEKIMTRFIIGRVRERIIEKITPFLRKIKKLDFKYIYLRKKEPFYIVWELVCVLRGLLIGIYFSFIGQKKSENWTSF